MLRVRRGHRNGPSVARLSAGRRVCRKYRKAYIRKLQQQEYDKLCCMVPSLAVKERKKRISKVKVIEATIRYIDQLHHALAERLHADGDRKQEEEQVARAAIRLFVEKSRAATTSPPSVGSANYNGVVYEKERRFPSYLLQLEILSRRTD